MISPEILRRYPFFGSLTDSQIKALAMIAEEQKFDKGAVICEEGQQAAALYILTEGGVSLYYKSEEEFHPTTRKEFLVGEISPGEVFAISVLIEPYKFSATVKAEQKSTVVRIDSAGLNSLFEKDTSLRCSMISKVAQVAMERLEYARVQLAAAWAK